MTQQLLRPRGLSDKDRARNLCPSVRLDAP
jgi:hypothetical protein